ncbi:MAG: p-hydroxybenzoic acid efflux pump subunit AaeB [Burkholderia lata]|uniref:p-hydroxybenzoic acid efflux pump subunit AaeB n=1 Tax=Burkholderia lata (strain ATCC 17760 / DSM 23089 / LMG 22485 / NCIMB 9086 / R18194 / 383) TaxID=482957 RepID=A0A833PW66_BURL3|nr:FUSC family protein [Burkholderia lata]KAF1040439.1 MAG: p-hydroxybenzoic acid efflux pump subunit AaeB [Burkholderia lata]
MSLSPSRFTSYISDTKTGIAIANAARDWAGTSGVTWLYIFKTLLAALLALGVAMKLELPMPRTAMTTVFVLMQPQSGMVLAKSLYRICGTIVGLLAMLVLISLFGQTPDLFLGATALWIGICTAGAARNRNFRTYGFVLAGYTAALIGIPAWQHPDAAFISAMTRVTEVTIGILSSGAVSALVFPQHVSEQINRVNRARFTAFADDVLAILSGRIDRAFLEALSVRIVDETVNSEAARSAAVFEGPDTRLRNGRLTRLNAERMTTSTRLHALSQLIARLRVARADVVLTEIDALMAGIATPVRHERQDAAHADDVDAFAASLAATLERGRAALPGRAQRARNRLGSGATALDFDTAVDLLDRFLDSYIAYTSTYLSLNAAAHEREQWTTPYEPRTNPLIAAVAGIRAMLLTLVLSTFWIATAWPSGALLVLNGGAICALVASSARPSRTAFQMAIGTAFASVIGLIVMFVVYPVIDGFPLLCVVLAAPLALGCWMTTRPSLAGYGIGYCIYFCFLTGPDNVVAYDPTSFMNDAIALVLSMLMASVAFELFLPPTMRGLRKHLLADLRRQVVFACTDSAATLRARFESRTRDLMYQVRSISRDDPAANGEAVEWFLSVIEIGSAVVDLRGAMAGDTARAAQDATPAWLDDCMSACRAIRMLFESPTPKASTAATHAVRIAIATLQRTMRTTDAVRPAAPHLQVALGSLHVLYSALAAPDSPLPAPNDDASAPGRAH